MLSECIEVMIMHPLDLIKTRFQLQNSSLAGGAQYTGVRDCARKMYAQVTRFRGGGGLSSMSCLVFRKDYSRSGRDCFPQSLWRHQRELGNSLHLNNFKKCFCLDQTNLVPL